MKNTPKFKFTIEAPEQTLNDIARCIAAVLDDEQLAERLLGPCDGPRQGRFVGQGLRRADLHQAMQALSAVTSEQREGGVVDWFGEGE